MKRFKLITSTLVVALALSACSVPFGSVSGHDEEEEETQSQEDLSGDFEPLTEDILEGTWVTELGMLCSFDFDNDIFTDCYGVNYDIVAVNDDSIDLCIRLSGRVYEFSTLALPTGDTLTIEASYDDGELYILDSVAHKIDSDFGEEVSNNLYDLLACRTFPMQAMGASMTFNDDLTTMTATVMNDSQDVDIVFTGYSFDFPSEDFVMNLWTIGEDVVMLGRGEISYCTESELDLPLRFLYYDAATDYIEIVDYSQDKSALPVLNTSPYSATITTEDGTFVQFIRQPGVFISEEVMYQYSDDTVDNSTYLIDMRSPFADELLDRAEVIGLDEGQLAERRLDFTDGYALVDLYDNQWPGEYVSIYSITSSDEEVGNSDWSVESYSSFCGVLLTGTEYVDSHPSTRIYFEYDGEPVEGLSIYMMYSANLNEPQAVDTTFEDGYAWAEVTGSAVYFLGTVDAATQLTQDSFFDIDPEDTIYGRNPEYEDIIPLVDMDYIERSYASVFVVDSPEDLASLTYFVNAYPRVYEDNFFVWVDVVDDIDISRYQWVPLGHDDSDGFRSFSGIFCGNGHTITGLTIDNNHDENGFFGDIYFSTVIGVNLEGAFVSGVSSGLFVGDTSTTDYYDCHAQGITPDNYDSGANLFHAFEEYGNNGYQDCSIVVVNANYVESSEEFSINLPDPNSTNELYELFDPEHDGTYDYSTDYFFD